MHELTLDPAQALVLTVVAYFVGRYLRERVSLLHRFLIPEAVVGGLVAAVVLMVLRLLFKVYVIVPTSNVMMLTFFTTIGLHAKLGDLKAGGKALGITLGFCVLVILIENTIPLLFGALFDVPPSGALMAGSVALIGGHGTAAAWGPIFGESAPGAYTVGVASATFGLIVGGLVGTPTGRFFINRFGLSSTASEADAQNSLTLTMKDLRTAHIDVSQFFACILVIAICVGMGEPLRVLVGKIGVMLPQYVTALVAGIIVGNFGPKAMPKLNWPQEKPAMRLIAEIALNIFLVRALMSLDLLSLAPVAGVLVLLTQVVAVLAIGIGLFFALRRSYDAAIIVSGFLGLSLGATPTAVANMSAITQENGPSKTAFLVVPLVGAFFIDLINGFVISGLHAAL